jgi:hypothetical protein
MIAGLGSILLEDARVARIGPETKNWKGEKEQIPLWTHTPCFSAHIQNHPNLNLVWL